VWAVAWVVATSCALRLPRRTALLLVLTAALGLRLAALAGPPTASDDLYRYAWDGRVQVAGIDPYAHQPVAHAVHQLREPWLWPDAAGCAALHRADNCTRINRPAVRTIYPPVAEAWFTTVYRISGIGAHHKAWQLAGLVTDLASVALIAIGLRRLRLDVRWTALYALCPAPVFEFVNNAHVDSLGVALILGALVVGTKPSPEPRREIWRDIAIGLLLGAAVLVKLYPALLFVALLGLPRARRWRSVAIASAAAAGLAVVAYLPHMLAVGVHVIGYLPGYLREEHYDQGSRFLLAGALGLPGPLAAVVSIAAVVATAVWVAWPRRQPLPAPDAARILLVALFLATTPVQPWYAVAAVAVAALSGRPWAAAVTIAGYPYFFGVLLDYHAVTIGRVSYGAALLVVLVTAVARPAPKQLWIQQCSHSTEKKNTQSDLADRAEQSPA
jgi:hypothetical protein